ncbi:ATP-dependent Clp protease ATP-binding subunit ClpX [Acrasis kona]|uniref:ATP-dependent Clp protease ATP-binding subunit ClpX n=1 Tax=Acrasis kona TaxID=1008807 RepID=A0AAW2ZN65_9EUKA
MMENDTPTYEEVAQKFQFLPMIINSLPLVTSTDPHKLNVQVTKLHEAMRQSLKYVDTLDGVDLTTKQQEETYKQDVALLQQKIALTEKYKELEVLKNSSNFKKRREDVINTEANEDVEMKE